MDTQFEQDLTAFLAERRNTVDAIARRARAVGSPRERAWFRIENAVAAEAEMWIFDDIGYDWFTGTGKSASQFVEELQAVTAKSILLHLNSGGGDLFEGLAIFAALKNHEANVTVQVEGLAASAASIIAMAGNRVLMARGSMMMIHEPSGVTVGPPDAHRKTADVLDVMAENMAGIYADRAGRRVNWRSKMKAETWMTDQQAVDAGLADEVLTTPAVQATADLSVYGYQNVPAELTSTTERVVQNITINNYGIESPPKPNPEPDPSPEPTPGPSQEASEPTEEQGLSVITARLLIDLAEAEVAAVA